MFTNLKFVRNTVAYYFHFGEYACLLQKVGNLAK